MWCAVALSLLVLPQEPRFPGYPEQDALLYELSLTIDPAAKQLEGTVRYRFRAARELDSIRLDATRGPQWKVAFVDGAIGR